MERPKRGLESKESADPMRRDFADEGVTIVRMSSEPIHTELDLEGFNATPLQMTPLIKRRLSDFADLAETFIAGSIVTDNFKHHGERRVWRSEMSKKYGRDFLDISEKNILRGNNLAGIYSWMHMIGESLDLFKVEGERADKIRALSAQLPDISTYDTHSSDEKVTIAAEYVRICEEYLRVLER